VLKKSAGYILPTHSQPASANRLIPTTVGTLPLSYAGSLVLKIGGIYLAHSLSAGKRQSVNPDYSRDSTTELRWITQLKNRRVGIFAHDWLEATANQLIARP
jgi:hypothetical protein